MASDTEMIEWLSLQAKYDCDDDPHDMWMQTPVYKPLGCVAASPVEAFRATVNAAMEVDASNVDFVPGEPADGE